MNGRLDRRGTSVLLKRESLLRQEFKMVVAFNMRTYDASQCHREHCVIDGDTVGCAHAVRTHACMHA